MELKYNKSRDKKYLSAIKLSLGLGSTSLIAACGGLGDVGQYFINFGPNATSSSSGGGSAPQPPVPSGPPPPPPPPVPAPPPPPPPSSIRPPKAFEEPNKAPVPEGYQWYGPVPAPSRINVNKYDISSSEIGVKLKWENSPYQDVDLFTEHHRDSEYHWYYIKGVYDLIFGHIYQKDPQGVYKIALYWDAPKYEANPSLKDNRLEIETGGVGDKLRYYDIINLNNNNYYDIVIRSAEISYNNKSNVGAIYIIWDVEEFRDQENKTVTLSESWLSDPSNNFKSLTVYGGSANETLVNLPLFAAIGSLKARDMLIPSYSADYINYDTAASPAAATIKKNTGALYIIWDISLYDSLQHVAFDMTFAPNSKPNTYNMLSIFGENIGDQVSSMRGAFQIGGDKDSYDLVMYSESFDYPHRFGTAQNSGAIYVVWDVSKYAGVQHTIHLGTNSTAAHGFLSIYAHQQEVRLGDIAPMMVSITGDDKVAMVLRTPSKDSPTRKPHAGEIHILWDIGSYASTKHKEIMLNRPISPSSSDDAEAGFLAIRGTAIGDTIGTYAPDFIKIAGNDYDMVIRASLDDFNGVEDSGAIFILWDIASYSKVKQKAILLDDAIQYSDAGALGIRGGSENDGIGIYKPEFLKIAGKNGYDVVIRDAWVDNGNVTNTGAIYILWDVADYSSKTNPKTHNINLGDKNTASSGLLTIYGSKENSLLGESYHNVFYGRDSDGNKILTDIDGDGTKDIAFKEDYTYILFGDEVASTTGTGVNKKVTSKTVDLAKIETVLAADTAAFFDYDFGRGSASAGVNQTDVVGYRFADRSHSSLAQVQEAYDAATGSGSAPAPAPVAPLTDFGSDTDLFV